VMMAYGLSRRVVLAGSLRRALQAKCSHLDHRPSAGLLIAGVTGTPPQPERARCRAATRYGGAAEVDRAADLYTQGWTLRQIGAELGVHWSTVSQQLRSAGVTMRPAVLPPIPRPLSRSSSSVTWV
jgi:hypothetical protein